MSNCNPLRTTSSARKSGERTSGTLNKRSSRRSKILNSSLSRSIHVQKSSLRRSNVLNSSINSSIHIIQPIGGSISFHEQNDGPSQPTKSRKETTTLRFLFGFSALYILLFGGAFWGWGPMQLMLQEHGSYRSLCDNGDNTTSAEPCPAQSARLLNV